MSERAHFRLCSTCKQPIAFEAKYFLCSVSTCNRKRMTLTFCSVECWDAHQADARHRDAGAEEARAPTALAWATAAEDERRKATAQDGDGEVKLTKVVGQASLDTLVIASKLKDYIRDRATMSTSDRAVGYLSDHLRVLLDDAALAAGKDGRRTVMDRDVLPLVAKGFESLATGAGDPDDRPGDILVVGSKVKAYVKARASMATSDSVLEVLSAHVRRLARQAIRKAGTDDRKTVLDRDFVGAVEKKAP